jgi:signal transduction histidine kinase
MPTLVTKRLLLSQVFSNLISNAIKHHDRPDGRVIISASKKGENWEFAVEGKEMARLVPSHPFQAARQPRVPGIDEGRFTVSDDFDDPLPEEVLNAFLKSNLRS